MLEGQAGSPASERKPALRGAIEPVPTTLPETGERVFALRDPFKLSPGSVVLPEAGLALASLLDGTRTLTQLASDCKTRFGFAPSTNQVAELVNALDGAGLLEGPALLELVHAFRAADVREPACIGSYPGDPGELRRFLEEQYVREGGPGSPPSGSTSKGPVRALISPHIDLHRGGHTYAWPWREVADGCEAELFVIFGTAHRGTAPVDRACAQAPLYALTRKRFTTPLGDVETDVALVDRLLVAYTGPDDLFAGEFHHRGEHSIEFQVVYLAHLFAGRRPVKILPILCGGLHQIVGPPSKAPRFLAFHDALRMALADVPPERVAFVAGIDFAHIGAQFQRPPVSADDVQRVAELDRETLRLAVEERSPDAVHVDISRDGDPREICGHSALVAFLEALRGAPLEGELLKYDVWHDGESAVSFAGAIYREV